MAKRKTQSVTFNKQAFLLPKMEVTEYGFYVRELSGRSLLEVRERAESAGDKTLDESFELLVFIVVHGTCDENAKPVFTDDDTPLLMEKSPMFLKEIVTKILIISGIPASFLEGFSEVAVDLKNDPPLLSTTESPTS